MFKAGRGARLSPADLKRFGRRFEADLEALMPGRTCRLKPLTDKPLPETWLDSECHVLPLSFRDRPLGYLHISPGVVGDDEDFLAELVRQGLEGIWLRKALMTDRETGLFSREYFGGRLLRFLRKHRRPGLAMSLSLDEEAAPELLLVLAELREAAAPPRSLLNFVRRLSQNLLLRCPTRSGPQQLAFLLEGDPDDIRLNLENALDDQVAAEPDSRPVAAWVRWPRDLGRDPGEAGPAQVRAQASELWEKAETALFFARQSRGAAVGVAFEDLVGHHGQIIQMLPMDRVIVNLGRLTGAASGQVFLISAPQDRPGVEPEYKGEATIFEVQDSYSLAYISGHKQARGIVAGDRLTFSRRDFETANAAVSGGADLPGFLAGLPPKEDFMARLNDFTGKPLALALARLDDYDKTISMFGREEGLRLLSFVFEKAASELPETRLKTLWQPDTLVLAWPGASAEDIKPAAHRAAADLKEQGPVSFGLVFDDGSDETAESLVDDGRKALREAAFSGPGQVAVFGPLALNISGDRLFEDGDLSGAVKEYERGLAIASEPRRGEVSPEADGSRLTTHLNLLNSLGVCFGRMGDSNQALGVFEKIVALDPDNMMAHYNLGYTHLLAGRLNEAEELLGRAAELAPNNFETLFHLGKTALELGHIDKALAALKKAGDLENARPSVYRLLGEVLLLAHDHQGAQAAFKKAVKASPNDAYSLSALGFLFMDVSNDLPVAESLLRKSVEIDPTNSLYRQRLGRLLFSLGQYDEAEHHLKTATEYGSRAPEVHYHLGRLAEEAGRNEEALAHFRAALEEDPSYQPALEKVGD